MIKVTKNFREFDDRISFNLYLKVVFYKSDMLIIVSNYLQRKYILKLSAYFVGVFIASPVFHPLFEGLSFGSLLYNHQGHPM